MEYTTRQLTKEEGDALSKEMLELLNKHDAELGVVSSIQILKRVEKVEEGIPTPFLTQDGENPTTTEEEATK